MAGCARGPVLACPRAREGRLCCRRGRRQGGAKGPVYGSLWGPLQIAVAASILWPVTTSAGVAGSTGSVHLRRRKGLKPLNPSRVTAKVDPVDHGDPGPGQEAFLFALGRLLGGLSPYRHGHIPAERCPRHSPRPGDRSSRYWSRLPGHARCGMERAGIRTTGAAAETVAPRPGEAALDSSR